MNSAEKRLIVILGPTAVGKTALAIQLAKQFQTEIISADSRQFYSELCIGVARPSVEELSQARHHFIAFKSLDQHYSAGQFERDALQVLNDLFAGHHTVVCAGGSGLYLDALLYGLDDLPSSQSMKRELLDTVRHRGLAWIQEELEHLDPEYSSVVDRLNPHRLIRAVEVCRLTGKKYSDLRKEKNAGRTFEIVKIGLTAGRDVLYQRINQRVDQMMTDGLEQEARAVFHLRHLHTLNTVGYKELFAFFDGLISREEAIGRIKQHTRNFAKRQMTWWRKDSDIHWTDITTEAILARVLDILGA